MGREICHLLDPITHIVLLQILRPFGFLSQYSMVHRATFGMGPWQVANTHQKFIHNFAARKPKRFLKEFDPLLLGFGVVLFEPLCKRTILVLQGPDGFRIFNRRIDFQFVTDNARILQKPFLVFVGIGGYFLNIKVVVGFAKRFFFFQNGFPAQSRLVDFHDQAAKQFVVVVYRKAVMVVVVVFVQSFSLCRLHSVDVQAIRHN